MKPGISHRAGISAGRGAPHGRGRRPARRFLLAGAAAAAAVASGALASPAGAAEGGSTTASVTVDSAIALTALAPSFGLTGIPGATDTEAVTYTVTTNDPAGYTVTVQSESDTLAPATVGNTDSIPIGALEVRETGTLNFVAVSDTVARTVHAQNEPSDADGNNLSTDYRITVPFVTPDTYSVTLDYLAAVQGG